MIGWLVAAVVATAPIEEVGGRTDVVVVANARSADSRELAVTYRRARRIDPEYVLELDLPDEDEISRITFNQAVARPLVAWWNARTAAARPSYVVLSSDIPLRVDGDGGWDGDEAAVDSELTRLPRMARGETESLDGPMPNPYRAWRPQDRYARFDVRAFDMVLVTRLDAFTPDASRALIARADSALASRGTPSGVALIDLRGGDDSVGRAQLRRAAQTLASAPGVRVQLDREAAFITEADSLLFYAAWGSNDPAYARTFDFGWRPGAVATTFVSSSARTFDRPPDRWRPGKFANPTAYFGGTPQSLIGDLIASGVTGVAGAVSEPWLKGCVHPDVLFDSYLNGHTLGEAFYLAMPYLSWRTIVVGDPLCQIAFTGAR